MVLLGDEIDEEISGMEAIRIESTCFHHASNVVNNAPLKVSVDPLPKGLGWCTIAHYSGRCGMAYSACPVVLHMKSASIAFPSKLLPYTRGKLLISDVFSKRNARVFVKDSVAMSVDRRYMKISARRRIPCHDEPRETMRVSKFPDLSLNLPLEPQEAVNRERIQNGGSTTSSTNGIKKPLPQHQMETQIENIGIPDPPVSVLPGLNNPPHWIEKPISLFLSLDATIKIPVLIFVPGFVAVCTRYGFEVASDLILLWVLGPPVAAAYVKIISGICGLYVFCFKQAMRIARKSPAYAAMAYEYAKDGRMTRDSLAILLWPVNVDYKALVRRNREGLNGWATERYLDFIESIWPFYCRIIRVLKQASLL